MADAMKFTADGVPKNWNGKDWQAYKFAMQMVFREMDLSDVVEGTITRSMLSNADAEAKFDKNQTKIMRLIGMSVTSEILHQIRDRTTGTEMWDALCDLFENKINKTVKAHTIRRLRDELWTMKFTSGGNMNLHMSKMFNIRTESQTLQYTVDDIDMVEMLLESLPNQVEFESLKSSIRYSADTSLFTPTKVRELIHAAAARQNEFRNKGGGHRGGNQKNGGNGGGVSENKSKTGSNQEEKSSDPKKKKKKQKRCWNCGSTEHLKSDCPDKADKSSGADANVTTEQKRKPRGNVTLRQAINEPHHSDIESWVPVGEPEDAGVMMRELDQMILDAGIEVDIREPGHQDLIEEVALQDAARDDVIDNTSGWWFFDTAANAHVTGNLPDFVEFTEDTSQSQSVHGVASALVSRIAGVGTVALSTDVNGELVEVRLNDVVYVPGAEFGLFSPGLAAEQGFAFDFDRNTLSFRVLQEGRTVIVASQYEATWGFFAAHATTEGLERSLAGTFGNATRVDGVASLEIWHERLGHTCPQYLKIMTDKGLVRGMVLTHRQLGNCDACHVGKQKKTPNRKKLDRKTNSPNQVVYADLLIPGQGNGTRFEAVLVLMDGFSRFVTIHLLKSKDSSVVNKHIMEYVVWAERQAKRGEASVKQVVYEVKEVLTDKGGEFCNEAMEKWYASRGIEHVRVGPKISQLNLCERTHQSLVGMMKAMMYQSGLPRSFWPEALITAVYIKNRVYNKGTGGIPFEMMFGVKPDIHHIRKFGSLAYVHVPVSPGHRKHQDNAKLGYVLGYAENVIGCKVFFYDEHTAKFVPDLRVAEDVMYRDWYEVTSEDADLESLHFKTTSDISAERGNSSSSGVYSQSITWSGKETEIYQHKPPVAMSEVNETMDMHNVDLEDGEGCATDQDADGQNCHSGFVPVDHEEVIEQTDCREDTEDATRVSRGETIAQIDGVTVAIDDGTTKCCDAVTTQKAESSAGPILRRSSSASEASDGNESVAGVCGSTVEEQNFDENDHEDDDAVTVASMFADSDGTTMNDLQSVPESINASMLLLQRGCVGVHRTEEV
ncbi:Retrovirus-related Pol polyprotein from transposon TNT 1-94 [Phytophthora citrophthora]|uniref:Retrovirus-related Pol polyprotein from transposon TNT 1-94 n=1 Tax=Phytophthora citrophthora TaxID=4793 RepID=A0AAD9GW95_9STRA|nr:Retrovirus-related Pol polyprotein from transposon TNT 1-94 [Phytophthora citrophthora]